MITESNNINMYRLISDCERVGSVPSRGCLIIRILRLPGSKKSEVYIKGELQSKNNKLCSIDRVLEDIRNGESPRATR